MILLISKNEQIPQHKNNGRYPDVIEGSWYVPYMIEGVEQGMLDPRATFGLLYPYGPVSRAQFLKLITVAYNLPRDLPYDYTDVPDEAWYAQYAGLSSLHKLFVSTGAPQLLQPNALVTHKEVADAIYRAQQIEERLQPVYSFPQPRRSLQPNVIATTQSTNESAVTTDDVKHSIEVQTAGDDMAQKTINAVINETNRMRQQNGLPPLQLNNKLQQSAQNHAKDMWQNNYFDHFSQDGRSYVDRIETTGYFKDIPACNCNIQCFCQPKFAVGENLAKGQLSAEQVVKEWMASEGHRKNILQPAFSEIGVGLFGDIWVQNFGKTEQQKVFVEVAP